MHRQPLLSFLYIAALHFYLQFSHHLHFYPPPGTIPLSSHFFTVSGRLLKRLSNSKNIHINNSSFPQYPNILYIHFSHSGNLKSKNISSGAVTSIGILNRCAPFAFFDPSIYSILPDPMYVNGNVIPSSPSTLRTKS